MLPIPRHRRLRNCPSTARSRCRAGRSARNGSIHREKWRAPFRWNFDPRDYYSPHRATVVQTPEVCLFRAGKPDSDPALLWVPHGVWA